MGMYGWHDNDLKAFNLEVEGTLTFGDAATDNFIIKGRVSSLTAAGSAIQITSAYAYGEGIEMRYQVTDWTAVGSSFKGMYLRSEAITNSAAGKSIYGAEIYGVCNNVTMTTGSLWSALFYSYVKGVDAVTVNNMYAVQGELTWDASRTGDCTITTAAACFRAKITGGRVADYTKIHGYELTIGEMDGDSQKFGYGLFMQDDSGMSGTSTLSKGIYVNIGCDTAIDIAGTIATTGIKMAGGASYNPIHIGTKANTAGSGLDMSGADSYDDHNGVMIFCDDGGALAATYTTSAIWTRYLISQSQTGNTATGAYLQMKSLAATLTTCDYSATKAYLELSDAVTLASGSLAIINASLELGGAFTDTAEALSGINVNINDGANALSTAKNSAGVRIRKTSGSTAGWPIGLYIEDSGATTGVEIGNATTGLQLDGDFTTGINLAGSNTITTGIRLAGGMTYNPIHIGTKSNTADAGLIMSGANSYDDMNGVMIFCDDGGDALASTYSTSPIWTRYLLTVDQTSNTQAGAYLQLKTGGSGTRTITSCDTSALKAYMEAAGAVTLATGDFAVINCGFEMGGTFTVAANCKLSGIDVNINDGGNSITDTALDSAGVHIRKTSGSTAGWPVGVKINDAGATTGIELGDATTGIQLDGTFTGNAIAVTQDALTVGDSYSGVRVAVTADAPTNAYGMAAYFDTTVTGTQANNIYNTGSWVNMGSGYTCAANKLTVAFEGGIYDGGATLTDAWFIGLQLQMVTASAPTTRNWFRFNYNDGSSGSMTAIFAAANPGSAAFASGAGTTSTKNGDIAIADIVGTGVVYVRTYDAAG